MLRRLYRWLWPDGFVGDGGWPIPHFSKLGRIGATVPKMKIPEPREAWGRFGIVNNVGSFWSDNTFYSRDEALDYIRQYEARNKACDLSKHTVVPVIVTIKAMSK